MRAGSSSIDNQFQDTSSSVMWVKKRSRVDYGATASEVEHRSEVKVDDSRPLDSCTVDEAVEKIGFGVFQAIVMLFSGLIWTTEAFEILLLTILSTVLKCEWGLNEVEEALLTSVVFIGYFFGAIFWGFFVDFYGRKWGIFFVSVLCSCFGLMSAFSPDFGMMVFLRALLGFASAGGGQGITLCTEYLPAKSRGIGIMQMKIFWVAGGIGIVAIGWATVPTLGWRWLLVFAAIPVTVMTFFIPLMPSSPRYLIIKGKREQALRNINIVSRINCKPKLHIKLVTDQEKAEMNKQDSLSKKDLDDDHFNGGLPGAISQKSKIQQSRVMELFRNGMWKTTLILWVIWLNIVAYYYGIILLTTALFQYNSHCNLTLLQHLIAVLLIWMFVRH